MDTTATWEIIQPTQEERDAFQFICITCKETIAVGSLTNCDHCHEYLHITTENKCGAWVPGSEDDTYWCNACLGKIGKLQAQEA